MKLRKKAKRARGEGTSKSRKDTQSQSPTHSQPQYVPALPQMQPPSTFMQTTGYKPLRSTSSTPPTSTSLRPPVSTNFRRRTSATCIRSGALAQSQHSHRKGKRPVPTLEHESDPYYSKQAQPQCEPDILPQEQQDEDEDGELGDDDLQHDPQPSQRNTTEAGIRTHKKLKGRGPTRNMDLDALPRGTKISVEINRAGEAERYPKFSSRLAMITRRIVPLSYFDWRKVPKDYKSQLIRKLEAVFDWGLDPMVPKYILKHAGGAHRSWRREMKNMYYNNRTFDEALRNVPPMIQPDVWKQACEHWRNPFIEERAKKNKINRAKAPPQIHCLGRMSIDSMKTKYSDMHDGAHLDRVRVYEMTHSKVTSDGRREWIHQSYQERHARMMDLIRPFDVADESLETNQQPSMTPEEAFKTVITPEHGSFICSVGRSEMISSWDGRKGLPLSSTLVDRLRTEMKMLQRRDEDRQKQLDDVTSQLREQNQAVKELINLLQQGQPGHSSFRDSTYDRRHDDDMDGSGGVGVPA